MLAPHSDQVLDISIEPLSISPPLFGVEWIWTVRNLFIRAFCNISAWSHVFKDLSGVPPGLFGPITLRRVSFWCVDISCCKLRLLLLEFGREEDDGLFMSKGGVPELGIVGGGGGGGGTSG